MKIQVILIILSSLSGVFCQECVTFKNTTGVCKLDQECKYFLKIWHAKNILELHKFMKTKCRNGNSSLIVCCPLEETIIAKSTSISETSGRDGKSMKTKWKKACKSFGLRPQFIPITTRIINGTEAKPNEFPHFAALGYKVLDEISFKCGGSLISKYFVLTAAHCNAKTLSMVRLGKHNIYDNENDDFEGCDYNIEVKHLRHKNC